MIVLNLSAGVLGSAQWHNGQRRCLVFTNKAAAKFQDAATGEPSQKQGLIVHLILNSFFWSLGIEKLFVDTKSFSTPWLLTQPHMEVTICSLHAEATS